MELKHLLKKLPSKQRKGPGGNMLDYIDARQVMDLLDEVCKPENWQCDYKEVAGKVYCGIGIRCPVVYTSAEGMKHPAVMDWVWKWDVGVESDFEPAKGEASDAFKRAAVKWGIGRFLYDMGPTVNAGAPEEGDGFGNMSICEKCGADMKTSQAGKLYCSAICWEK